MYRKFIIGGTVDRLFERNMLIEDFLIEKKYMKRAMSKTLNT